MKSVYFAIAFAFLSIPAFAADVIRLPEHLKGIQVCMVFPPQASTLSRTMYMSCMGERANDVAQWNISAEIDSGTVHLAELELVVKMKRLGFRVASYQNDGRFLFVRE